LIQNVALINSALAAQGEDQILLNKIDISTLSISFDQPFEYQNQIVDTNTDLSSNYDLAVKDEDVKFEVMFPQEFIGNSLFTNQDIQCLLV
jgi:hypothetical protein